MIEFFPSTRVFVQIGPVAVMWYAVLIVIGAGIAYAISLRNLKKLGYDQDLVDSLFIGVMLAGVVGARLWYVAFSSNLADYLRDPLSILMMREGGLAIQGGLVLGVVYGYFFAKRHNLSFWQWSDQIVPNILIAQAIGRWGNFINQEAYGRVVDESFYRFFPGFIKDMMFINGYFREPTFLYESLANILGWVLIILVLKRFSRVRRGDLTFAYLMWYGVTRFFIEGLRSDSLMLGDRIRMAQLTSIVFVAIGVAGYLGFFRKKDRKPVLLFDFDGTLMDTEAAIHASFVYVFETMKPDYHLSDEELLSFVGPTLKESFSKHFNEEDTEKCIAMYREHNREMQHLLTHPLPDMEEVVLGLKEKGYTLGIVSSKQADRIRYSLKDTRVKDVFDIIVGSDDVDKHKPDPEGIIKAVQLLGYKRDQIVYIGDTRTDVKAGKNAGAFTIAYLSNPKRKEELEDEKPNRIVMGLKEIEDILKEDHEWTVTMM